MTCEQGDIIPDGVLPGVTPVDELPAIGGDVEGLLSLDESKIAESFEQLWNADGWSEPVARNGGYVAIHPTIGKISGKCLDADFPDRISRHNCTIFIKGGGVIVRHDGRSTYSNIKMITKKL